MEQLKKLKKLIEKWKADLKEANSEFEQCFDDGLLLRSSALTGKKSQLQSCISEAEQLLQETGEGREEAIAVLYNHYKVNCPDEMTFDEFVKMKDGDDAAGFIIRATLGAMEEYRQQGQGVDEKEVCNLLASYSKELASIEELGDKGRIQIRHAKEIIKYFASHPTKH